MFKLSLIFVAALGQFELAQASYYYSGNKCDHSPTYDTRSICRGGRTLPRDRVRNSSDKRLECTGNVDNYIRLPQKELSFFEWADNVKYDRKEAYTKKRQIPLITHAGTVPYQTVEVWEYEECETVTSSFECGSHLDEECHQVDDYDKEGKRTGSHQECHMVSHANTCDIDVTHTTSLDCSYETMKYSWEFVRPTEVEWNLDSEGYVDAIPNKYDLLPGEVEAVQTYNNGTRSRVMSPHLAIGDAWNEYNLKDVKLTSGSTECLQDANLGIHARIITVKRDRTKATPNAFRLPIDWEGNAMEALLWQADKNDEGLDVAKAIPWKLRLDDTSGAMISLMAAQSRENAAREQVKYEEGENHNPADQKADTESKKDKAFWKNTQVRVRLFEDPSYWWEVHWNDLHTNDGEAIVPNLHMLSNNEETQVSDLWEIVIYNPTEPDKNIFDDGYLKPKRKYKLKVSMYQRGVGLYKQSCEDDPEAGWWSCGWPIKQLGWGRNEKHYFSKDLEINFTAPENYDKRGGWDKYNPRDWFDYMFSGFE
ncbi:MAG: hypothetical protein JNM93_04650 [Bacteriovoracaceae bacterium]|nr:hypothetical protein [Bacteriovoracaceae bacterium]